MSQQWKTVPEGVCRRQQADRRQANFRSMCYALFKSRRKGQRRTDDEVNCYTDYYDHYTVGVVLLLMVLCVLDAYFTLLLLQYGSIELNPVLAWAINKHALFFFLLKYTVTGLSVVVAAMHKNFRMFGLKGSHFLLITVVGYAILLKYQLSMLLPIWLNHSF